MKRAVTNYFVDLIIGGAFLVAAVSSIVFLLPSSWIAVTSAGQTSLLGVDMAAWSFLHKWSGIAMIGGVVLHTLLHIRWIGCMTRRVFGRRSRVERPRVRPVAGTARPSAAHLSPQAAGGMYPARALASDDVAHGVPPATAAPVQTTGPFSAGGASGRAPDPPTDRRRDDGSRRYTRKAFLGAATAVVAGATLIGVTLAAGGTESQSDQNGNDSGTGADSGSTDEVVAQTTESQSSQTTDGASQSSDTAQAADTQTSARVVVDASRCTACGSCLQTCPAGVFTLDASTGTAVAAAPDACYLCGRCVQVCGPQAITLNA